MLRPWNRILAAILGAAAILLVAAWFDTSVLVGIRQNAGQTFDIAPITWAETSGFFLIALAVLAIDRLARWAHSLVVGLAYLLVGALFAFLLPLVWVLGVQVNGAPAFLSGPLLTLVDNLYAGAGTGLLNATAIIGAVMVLVGLVTIVRVLRARTATPPAAEAASST